MRLCCRLVARQLLSRLLIESGDQKTYIRHTHTHDFISLHIGCVVVFCLNCFPRVCFSIFSLMLVSASPFLFFPLIWSYSCQEDYVFVVSFFSSFTYSCERGTFYSPCVSSSFSSIFFFIFNFPFAYTLTICLFSFLFLMLFLF